MGLKCMLRSRASPTCSHMTHVVKGPKLEARAELGLQRARQGALGLSRLGRLVYEPGTWDTPFLDP